MPKGAIITLVLTATIIASLLIRGIGIPVTAKPSYNLKGFGLSWSWKKELRNGCIHWTAAPSHDYVNAYILSNQNICDTFDFDLPDLIGSSLGHASYDDNIIFIKKGAGGLGGGKPCPFNVSQEEIEVFQKLVVEAKKSAGSTIELPVLNKIEMRLKNVDGQKLLTDVYRGCSDLKPEDYRKTET